MPDEKLTLEQFSQKIKEKYPQYKDVDDLKLIEKILNKYPVYQDMLLPDALKKKETTDVGLEIGQLELKTQEQDIQSILEKNKDKDFVQRIINPAGSPKIQNFRGTGADATHMMAAEIVEGKNLVFPTIIRKEGKLVDLSPKNGEYPKEAVEYALKTGEYIEFPTLKEAIDFSGNNGYKKVMQQNEFAQTFIPGLKRIQDAYKIKEGIIPRDTFIPKEINEAKQKMIAGESMSTQQKKPEEIPEKNQSIYELAINDTERWYGRAPSPERKLNSYDFGIDNLAKNIQAEIDAGADLEQSKLKFEQQKKELADRLGLLYENGQVKVTDAELDKFKEVYSRKLDERISSLSAKNKNPYVKDVLGNLGSGSTQVLATPYNLLAISERLGNAILKPIGIDPSTYWQDFSKYINENQAEMAENSKRYDEDIISLAKSGETGKAIGSAVLQTIQTLPMLSTLIMGNAAGATNKALSFMGASTGAQEYMSNNDKKDIGEFYKVIDAFGAGMSEMAFEAAGTVKILEGIKKGIAERGANIVQTELTDMLRTNMERNVSMIMRGNSDMMREGITEGMTQLTQNLMAKATTDPGRNIWEGVNDATIVGALIGKGINVSLNAANNIQTYGARQAIKDAVKQIPDNYSIEAKEKLTPLIAQRDALERSIEGKAKPIQELVAPTIKAIDDATLKIAAKEEGMELPEEEKPKEGEKKGPEAEIPKSEVKVSAEGITSLETLKIEKKIEEKPKEGGIENAEEVRINKGELPEKRVPIEEGEEVGRHEIQQPAEAGPEAGNKAQRLTKEQEAIIHDRLVGRINEFNELPKRSVQRKGLQKSIMDYASKLGYTVDLTHKKLQVLKNGKPIRMISVKRTEEQIKSHKSLNEYGDQKFKDFANTIIEKEDYLVGLKGLNIENKDIANAIKQIREGKKSAVSNDLLDYLSEAFENGEIKVYDKYSRITHRIPIEEYLKTIKSPEEITQEEIDNIKNPEFLEPLLDKYEDGTITPEELNTLKEQLFQGEPYTEEDFQSLVKQLEHGREEEISRPVEEAGKLGKAKGKIQGKESAAAAEARIKLDAEIADYEKQLANKIAEKEKFVNDYNKRNELFGDKKLVTEDIEKGKKVVIPPSDLSLVNFKKNVDGFNAEIKKLEDKIDNLKKSKEKKIKEAGAQQEMFKEKVTEFKYRLLYRPFDIGTYPKEGFIRWEDDGSKFGVVVMNKQLTEKEYSAFDLQPITDIENLKGKVFVDKDGYYSRIELDWWKNGNGANVSLYDKEGNLVEKPFSMSAKEILKNISDNYWIEKPPGGRMEFAAFAKQPTGKKKAKKPKPTTITKPTPTTERKKAEGPKKRWIDEDKMTNEGLKGIEPPEIIKMIKQLSGKFPLLKNFRKHLGMFYHREGGDSAIALSRKLFTQQGIVDLAKAITHEFGHFVDYLPDKTLKRGNLLGRIASLKEYFIHTLAEKPGKEATVLTDKDRAYIRKEAERSLKEEYKKGIREIIEEVIKEEPIFEESGLNVEDILGIWNDNQARENNPELYEYIAKLSAYQKKRIIADALKGLIDTEILKKFSKGKQVGVKITREFVKKIVTPKPVDSQTIRDRYRELLKDEINKRHLFESEVIREELESLSKWWNPYDENLDPEYTKYRKEGKELYAEALSVLLNNPQALAEKAPFFNRAFFNYFDKKPTVKQLYDEIQDLISKPKEVLQQDRLNRVYEGFKRAEEKRVEISKKVKVPKLNAWDKFLKDYISMILPIIKRIPEPRKLGIELNDRQVLRDTLEKLAFANEKVAVMLVQMNENINEELVRSGLAVDDFSALLEVERNISQRIDIANPYAFQQVASAELKAFIEGRFTGEQKETMDRVKKTFHDRAFDIITKAHEAGMFTPEQYAYISKFKDSYATFQVVDYIDRNSIPASFKHATGTLKEIESPYISTLFKLASVIKGIERQNAVNAFIEAYNKYLPGEIKESERRMAKVTTVGFKDVSGKGRIEYWKNGKWSGLDVDPYIAEFFDMNKAADMDSVIKLFHYFNKGFKPLVTTWNVGWAFFSNIFRDHPRTFYNMFAILASTEGLSKTEAMKMPYTYFKSLIKIFPHAKKFVDGELTPLIEDMIEQGVLRHGFFGSYDPQVNESLGPIFQAARMIKPDKSIRDKMAERSKILKFGLKILSGIEYAGQIFEVSSKMTAFNLMKQKLGNARSAGFYTRNYGGTPNYLEKGTHTRTSNEILTFSNVIMQAIRTDSEIAFKPQTRGAYWLAHAVAVATPALLMGFAANGLFGDELEDLYAQITEYEKTNYLCIVWGSTKDGRPVYTKIPIPEFSRITHGITYKTINAIMNQEGFDKRDIGQLLAVGSSLTPSPSPLVKTAIGWGSYIFQKNPYDFFYGNNVLTDRRLQEARGWPALKKMVNWSIKNMGGTWLVKFYDYDPMKNTTTEYILKNIPLVSRMVKIGGFGQSETLSKTGERIRQEKARESLKLDKTINKYVLQALNEGKDLTNSNEIVDEMKKEIYGTDQYSSEQNKEFSYTKKKFKTRLIKGVDSPFSSTVSSIMDSKSNDEKVAKLQDYALIYGEDKFYELIKYLSNQELISKDLKSKMMVMLKNVDIDENKRNTIIQSLNKLNKELETQSEVPEGVNEQ